MHIRRKTFGGTDAYAINLNAVARARALYNMHYPKLCRHAEKAHKRLFHSHVSLCVRASVRASVVRASFCPRARFLSPSVFATSCRKCARKYFRTECCAAINNVPRFLRSSAFRRSSVSTYARCVCSFCALTSVATVIVYIIHAYTYIPMYYTCGLCSPFWRSNDSLHFAPFPHPIRVCH